MEDEKPKPRRSGVLNLYVRLQVEFVAVLAEDWNLPEFTHQALDEGNDSDHQEGDSTDEGDEPTQDWDDADDVEDDGSDEQDETLLAVFLAELGVFLGQERHETQDTYVGQSGDDFVLGDVLRIESHDWLSLNRLLGWVFHMPRV